jgi:hypothetical protein
MKAEPNRHSVSMAGVSVQQCSIEVAEVLFTMSWLGGGRFLRFLCFNIIAMLKDSVDFLTGKHFTDRESVNYPKMAYFL